MPTDRPPQAPAQKSVPSAEVQRQGDATDEVSATPPAQPPTDALVTDEESGLPESVRQKLETWVPELVRRAFTTGLGAVATTEEGIRRLTRDIPQPKEVAGYLVNTASTTKDEFRRVVASEVRAFLQTVNLSEEIAKMLTTLSFEVKTEIRFIPNDQKYGGVEPSVKSKVRLKRDSTPPESAKRGLLRRRRPDTASPSAQAPDDAPDDDR